MHHFPRTNILQFFKKHHPQLPNSQDQHPGPCIVLLWPLVCFNSIEKLDHFPGDRAQNKQMFETTTNHIQSKWQTKNQQSISWLLGYFFGGMGSRILEMMGGGEAALTKMTCSLHYNAQPLVCFNDILWGYVGIINFRYLQPFRTSGLVAQSLQSCHDIHKCQESSVDLRFLSIKNCKQLLFSSALLFLWQPPFCQESLLYLDPSQLCASCRPLRFTAYFEASNSFPRATNCLKHVFPVSS